MQQALEALKGLFGTPENWEGGGVAVWRLGGSGAPRRAIIALEATLMQPVQEPAHGDIRALKYRIHELEGEVIGYKRILQEADTPPQRKPLTDDVLVPLEVLEAAASSLDSFCGDLGWGDADLQNMDNLFAIIEQHKAAHNIKEKNT
jgi:hypothetical protein